MILVGIFMVVISLSFIMGRQCGYVVVISEEENGLRVVEKFIFLKTLIDNRGHKRMEIMRRKRVVQIMSISGKDWIDVSWQ